MYSKSTPSRRHGSKATAYGGGRLLSFLLASCGQSQTLTSPSPPPRVDLPSTPTLVPNVTPSPIPFIQLQIETPQTTAGNHIPTLRENARLTPGQPIHILWIQMIDAGHGWAIDHDGHILYTHAGGNAWFDVTPPQGEFEPDGFFAFDSKTAWATFSLQQIDADPIAPEAAFVWHTDDGGMNWRASREFSLITDSEGGDVPIGYYQPIMMQFVDNQTGWLLVDVLTAMNSMRPLLFQSTDSGITWNVSGITWNVVNDHYHDLDSPVAAGFVFADELTGWFGQNAIPLKFAQYKIDDVVSSGGWETIKSIDGGKSFDLVTSLPLTEDIKRPEYAGQYGDCGETRMLPIATDVIGIEWGCGIYSNTLSAFILTLSMSTDGGTTWKSFSATGNEFFLDAFHGWRLTGSGTLEHTIDGGSNWVQLKNVDWGNAQFDFVNETLGWAVVSNEIESALIRSIDGGETWQQLEPIVIQ